MNDFILKDSGERRGFDTGSVRDTDTDKPRYDLIPPEALLRLALLYTRGAKKYDARNWEKGQPVSVLMASLMRHLEAYRLGERTEDHMAAVAWNAFAIMTFEERARKGDETALRMLDEYAAAGLKDELEMSSAPNAWSDLRDRILGQEARWLARYPEGRWSDGIARTDENPWQALADEMEARGHAAPEVAPDATTE